MEEQEEKVCGMTLDGPLSPILSEDGSGGSRRSDDSGFCHSDDHDDSIFAALRFSTKRERGSVSRVPILRAVDRKSSPIFSKQTAALITFRQYKCRVIRKDGDCSCHFDRLFSNAVKIGSGSFGDVFRVTYRKDGRQYAVKKTCQPYKSQLNRKERMEEVRVLELIGPHPNITQFHFAFEELGHLYIMYDLYAGNLEDYLYEKRLETADVWNFTVDLLEALSHLHSFGYKHMDVKPSNVLLSPSRVCKLGDFGLVARQEMMDIYDGDSRYLAPEVLCDRSSTKSDVFSVGITMLEMATDLLVPGRGDEFRFLRSGRIPDRFTNDLDASVERLVSWMLCPSEDERPSVDAILSSPIVDGYRLSRREQLFEMGEAPAQLSPHALRAEDGEEHLTTENNCDLNSDGECQIHSEHGEEHRKRPKQLLLFDSPSDSPPVRKLRRSRLRRDSFVLTRPLFSDDEE